MCTSAALRSRGVQVAAVVAATVLVVVGPAAPATAANATPSTPDLARAVHYLATTTAAGGVADSNGTSLAKNGYYESFAQFADFGLTIDGALALAATGTDNAVVQKVVDVIDGRKKDGSRRTVDDWTGIGTAFASGGSIAKEALLAEVTGNDPHRFGGHDLIAALASEVCTTTDDNGCAGPGNYLYATSTFSQALGVIAQLRAGDPTGAAPAITYLEGLQNTAGAWPSLLPSSNDSDVDSTAMAAMALALLPNDATAVAAVTKAETWIAGRQASDGGFTGIAGESSNSAALAIQGLKLAGSTYSTEITAAAKFLAGLQNADGGFNVAADGQPGSDVRASAQVVGGIVGTPFGTLSDPVSPTPPTTATTTTTVGGGKVGGASTPTTSTSIAPSTSTSSSTTSTTVGSVVVQAVPASLPATGTGAARTLAWVALLLGCGLLAMLVGRRRHAS